MPDMTILERIAQMEQYIIPLTQMSKDMLHNTAYAHFTEEEHKALEQLKGNIDLISGNLDLSEEY